VKIGKTKKLTDEEHIIKRTKKHPIAMSPTMSANNATPNTNPNSAKIKNRE
jgi:hypothetical protein